MKRLVVHGATLRCSEGSAPSALRVTRSHRSGDAVVATVDDHEPHTNVAAFGTCKSAKNPAVQAAAGTPQPCMPVLEGPWSDETGFVEVDGRPALVETAECRCQHGGTIEVVEPKSPHGVKG